MIGPAAIAARTVLTPTLTRTALPSFGTRRPTRPAGGPITIQPTAGMAEARVRKTDTLTSQGYADQKKVIAAAPATVGSRNHDRNRPCDHLPPRPTRFNTT